MLSFNRYRSRACLLMLLFCILFFSAEGRVRSDTGTKQKPSDAPSIGKKFSHPYCGLYCLYSAIKLEGKDIEFKQLVKPEYLGSRRGSSLAELKKAAEDFGLYAQPVAKITSRGLCQLSCPVILHVKSALDKKQYDHYELFIGAEYGKAKLFNPPEQPKLVPFYQLAPRWDGTALIVSAKPINLDSVFGPARKRLIIYMAVFVAFILIVHWLRGWWRPSVNALFGRWVLGVSAVQFAGLAVTSLLVGFVYHFANDEGLLAHPTTAASIQKAHLGNFIPKVSEEDVRKLLNTGTVFVDARFPGDFNSAHLQGAINVPVNASEQRRQRLMADVARDARIVVYCQSVGCKFAEKIAIKLIEDGFSNVSIFKAGWHKWAANKDKKEKTSS